MDRIESNEVLYKNFLQITGRKYEDFASYLEFSIPNNHWFQAVGRSRSEIGKTFHDGMRADYWAPDMYTSKITLYFNDGSEKSFYENERNILKEILKALIETI